MAVNGKRKGQVGELEAAKAWAAAFHCEARRGQQFSGSPDSPDVVQEVPGVHLEVKRTERLRVYAAVEQAVEDAGDKVPIVLHRQNGRPWVAIIPLDRLPEVCVRLYLWLAAEKEPS